MKPIHKETRIVAFEVEGPNLSGQSFIQTRYDYDLKVHEIANKPAFMVNTTSQILFPSNDRIIFGCFASFFFENRNNIPTAEELLDLVFESVEMINDELRTKTNFYDISLEPPNRERTLSELNKMVMTGFRLN